MKSKIIEFLASKLKNNSTCVEPFNVTHPGHAAPLSILLPLGMLLFLDMLLQPTYSAPLGLLLSLRMLFTSGHAAAPWA
jgi:hypothetical protein